MHNKNSIGLRHVCFEFSENNPFFKDLSIDFHQNALNFICGKNGTGKSTLLKILAGKVLHGLSGQLIIDEKSYDFKDFYMIQNSIGMVAQNFDSMLVSPATFYENLQFAQLPKYPGLAKLSSLKTLPNFIKKYGIDPHIPVYRLSGGQRQILSILMVLERLPKLLLLDEPTAALDEENAQIVMSFLQELCLQKDLTIVAIVHDFDLVKKYAPDKYIQLYQKENGIRDMQIVKI
ncbi:MAG: ATP-binding cassette domain-containing protein [Candidatus Chromulinivorax sp.]